MLQLTFLYQGQIKEGLYSLADDVPLVELKEILIALLFFELFFPLQGNDGLCLGLIYDLVLACLSILVPLEHDGLVLIDEVLWGASLSVSSVMSHNTLRVFLKVLYTIKVK